MLFDAHNHAFAVLGGVPRRGIYDNMRTAVDRVRRGKERDVNPRFAAMVSHFLFEAEFCNPASGWEKGQVEKNVRDARHRQWQVVPPFPSLPDLNAWLQERCVALWHEIEHGKLPGTVADVWARESSVLMPMTRPFDGFVEHTKRVSPTCLIHFERNRYSVPASYANRPVSLRVYADRLVVAAEGQIVCEHQRLIERTRNGKSKKTLKGDFGELPIEVRTVMRMRYSRMVNALAAVPAQVVQDQVDFPARALDQSTHEVAQDVRVQRAIEGLPAHLALVGDRGYDRQAVALVVDPNHRCLALGREAAATDVVAAQAGLVVPVDLVHRSVKTFT